MDKAIYLLSILVAAISCQSADKTSSNLEDSEDTVLGTLNHPFKISEPAQEAFETGLLLLHSFEYEDAREAFQEAVAADDKEIMAHWGEAMTHYKALWGLQDVDAGREILNRLGSNQEERMATINDPLEKDLWQAVELLYGECEFDDRNKSYSKFMASLYEKHPGNQEIAAFHALGLIWSSEEYGDGSEPLRQSARIADGILAENPLHPGALHYKIHALDGPISAIDAQLAADRYAKVAPDAAHALHMPSHIYLALGRWDDVVSSNEASYAASVVRMEEKGLKDGARGYHSFAWLHYGLLQQGRYQEAQSLLQDMLNHVPNDPTKGARVYLLGMQNRQLVEAGKVDQNIALDLDVDTKDLGLEAASLKCFLNAQVAMENKNAAEVKTQTEKLIDQINVASTLVGEDGKALCSAGATRYAPNEDQINKSRVVLQQLNAMAASLENDEKAFEKHLLAATELEAASDFPTGPPRIAYPSFEQYGEWLLEQGRFEDALSQYETSLIRTPRRAQSLMGKMNALKGLKRMDEAKEVQEELQKVWQLADGSVKELIAAI